MSKTNTIDDNEFIKKLCELGYENLPVNMCGAEFLMTQDEFYDKFMDNKQFSIAYEKGRNKSFREAMIIFKSSIKDGNSKSLEQMMNTVFNVKNENTKSSAATHIEKKVIKKNIGLNHLIDPSKIVLKKKPT